jgi:hypothetical protein
MFGDNDNDDDDSGDAVCDDVVVVGCGLYSQCCKHYATMGAATK